MGSRKGTIVSTKILEQKARFLETTLENMQNHSDFIFKTIKRTERKNPSDPSLEGLRAKLKDLNKGTQEVREKANILWKTIASLERQQQQQKGN